jgi:hypothetical protein
VGDLGHLGIGTMIATCSGIHLEVPTTAGPALGTLTTAREWRRDVHSSLDMTQYQGAIVTIETRITTQSSVRSLFVLDLQSRTMTVVCGP